MTRSITPIATGLVLLFVMLLLSALVNAESHAKKIDELLAQKEEPSGVVFEIVTGRSNSLDWALPLVNRYIEKLRKKFPEIDVSIVTHGSEQFALTKKEATKKSKVHSITQQLNKSGVPLHVCETHAGWKGVSAEDFPDYVNVSTTGPAQVNDYVEVGYTLIIISSPG